MGLETNVPDRAIAILRGSMGTVLHASDALESSAAWRKTRQAVDHLNAQLAGFVPGVPTNPPMELERAKAGEVIEEIIERVERMFFVPEYLSDAGPNDATFQLQIPREDAEADDLVPLADFLDELALALSVKIDGDTAHFQMSLGNRDAPALTASFGPGHMDLIVDLGAARDSSRHLLTLMEGPATDRGIDTDDVELDEVAGMLRARARTRDDGVGIEVSVAEAVRINGRTGAGPLDIAIAAADPVLAVVADDAGGALAVQIRLGAVDIVWPQAGEEADESRVYHLPQIAADLAYDQTIRASQIMLGKEKTTVNVNGELALGVEINPSLRRPAGLSFKPGPGHVEMTVDPDLTIKIDYGGDAYTLTLPKGTTVRSTSGANPTIRVSRGSLTITCSGADGDVSVPSGKALVTLQSPRGDESHPVLQRFGVE